MAGCGTSVAYEAIVPTPAGASTAACARRLGLAGSRVCGRRSGFGPLEPAPPAMGPVGYLDT
ncbi:hypothetical protein [Streptomyces sp. NPDC059874]|uniref:hypothetical protein n=1 Tax=Streptomyces sp. NPDC059874 TaxID=3346983 RepID=UPI003664B8F2